MKHRSDVYDIFLTFQKLVENLFGRRKKVFQSDVEKNLIISLESIFLHHAIYFRKSCLRAHEQNEVAEQKHCHIIEMASTFLLAANLPGQF